MEVLVAFSLLATLLTVIIQSQGETAYFLEKTKKLSVVQNVVINELLRIEREYSKETITSDNGTFESDHELAGDQWQREVTQEDFMGVVPVNKITFRVIWIPRNGKAEQQFEASILGEVK